MGARVFHLNTNRSEHLAPPPLVRDLEMARRRTLRSWMRWRERRPRKQLATRWVGGWGWTLSDASSLILLLCWSQLYIWHSAWNSRPLQIPCVFSCGMRASVGKESGWCEQERTCPLLDWVSRSSIICVVKSRPPHRSQRRVGSVSSLVPRVLYFCAAFRPPAWGGHRKAWGKATLMVLAGVERLRFLPLNREGSQRWFWFWFW